MTEKKEARTGAGEEVRTERIEERPETYYTPPADIYETDDAILVEADMPGVVRSGVEVKIDNGLLILLGRVKPKSVEGVTQLCEGLGPGDYYRAFTLTGEIDEGKISAVISDGVLRVTLPKAEHTRARRIEVK